MSNNNDEWRTIKYGIGLLVLVLITLAFWPPKCHGAEVEPCHPQEVYARVGVQSLAVMVAQIAIHDSGVAELLHSHDVCLASRLGYHLAAAGLSLVVGEAGRIGYAQGVGGAHEEYSCGGRCSVVFVGSVGAPMRIAFHVYGHPGGKNALGSLDGVVVEAYVSRPDGVDVLLVRETLLADGIHETN